LFGVTGLPFRSKQSRAFSPDQQHLTPFVHRNGAPVTPVFRANEIRSQEATRMVH
jgi:hypothetical protein